MTDLVLSPRDGLFLKDGREWATSEAGRAHSLAWSMPSTLLGALVTAHGRLKETTGQRLAKEEWQALAEATSLGPMIALRRLLPGADAWQSTHRVWPVPADALFFADAKGTLNRLRRLDPRPAECSTLGRDDEEAREALWWPRADDPTKPARARQWWSEAAFVAWLADPAVEPRWKDAFRGLALPRHTQSHVGICPKTLTARDKILFAHDVVETIDGEAGAAERAGHREWAIGCRVSPEVVFEEVTLGGDRRLARVEPASADLFAFPGTLADAFERSSPGLRLVAVTPTLFDRGWLPDGFRACDDNTYRGQLPGAEGELILRAALVPRATHVSGWDMATGRPKPTTRLVPPGAVYHLVRADGAAFTCAEAERLWLAALGGRTREGFGRFVPGVWHPQEEGK
jgi:CRISPR-associated protein Cmr3